MARIVRYSEGAVYCDTGQFEGRYRLSVRLYLTPEELELLNRNPGVEVDMTVSDD